MATVASRIEVQKLYIAYFGRPADETGLVFYGDSLDGLTGAALTTAIEAIATGFGTSAEAAAIVALSTANYISAVYLQAFGRAYDATTDGTFWTDAITAGTTTKEKAMVEILNGASGSDTTAVANKLAVAETFTAAVATGGKAYAGADAAAAAKAVLDGVTSVAGTLTTGNTAATAASDALSIASAGTGTAFALTTSVDSLTGTALDDTFTANVAVNPANGTATVETLSALDTIDGGAGIDTLDYITVGATAFPGGTITNVETINMRSDGAATFNANAIIGVESISAFATGAAVDVDVTANATSVTVTGTATTVAIDDNGTATSDKLTTVSVTGNTGALTIGAGNATAITTLNSTSTNQNATVTAAAGTRALTINADKVTAGTFTDDTATTLILNATNSTTTVANGFTEVDASAATSVTLNTTTVANVIGDLDVAAATGVTFTGNARTTLTTGTYTAVTAFDASGSTGGVTISSALAVGDLFTGGTGNDILSSVGATTQDIVMGDGDDTATLTTAALGTSGSIDAGAGTADTLGMTAANAITASANATFEGTISNFERVSVDNVAAGGTINMANLDDISYLTVAGVADNQDLAVTNLASGGTINLTAAVVDAGAAEGLTVSVSGAPVSTTDVFNLALTSDASITNTGVVTVADVETINITTADATAVTTATAAAVDTVVLTAAAATSVVVSGVNGLTLTATGSTLISNLDASGVAGNDASDTGPNLAVTYTSLNTTTATSITGGAGNDALSAAVASTFAQTITGGAGNDAITGGAGNDIISTGAGTDTVDANAGADKITLGAGVETLTFNDADSGAYNTATALVSSTSSFDIIMGATAGDIINLTGSVGTEANYDGFSTAIAGSNFTSTITTTTIGQFIGTYDTAANTFTSDTTGGDIMLSYSNGDGTVADESIVITGQANVFANAEIDNGILTIA